MPSIVETPQDFAVGCSVRLRLDDKSDEVSGQIFAVDSARGMLLLQHPAERHNTFDFTLINTGHVLEVVEAVPPERRASSAEEPLPDIDPARTKDRFQRSFRAAQLAAEKIGIGVSR